MQHLTDIAVFVKVVELSSFTAAAAALEMSQPVVSKAVTRLEEIENAELEVARFQTEPRGTLRVSAPMSFGSEPPWEQGWTLM